jgi:hypothetical protein
MGIRVGLTCSCYLVFNIQECFTSESAASFKWDAAASHNIIGG